MRRVVVTGLGALTPIGNNLDEFWNACLAGESGAAPITKFDTTAFKTKFACELKDFKSLDFFDKKEIRMYDDFTKYALISVSEAVADAEIQFESLNKDRIGVIWGSGNGGVQTFESQMKEFYAGDGTPRFNPYFMARILVDIAAGVISMKYGLRGVNYCPVSACATSTTAIIDAFNYIRWNKADVIITGGSEAPIGPSTIGGFGSARALSTMNDSPKTASRPFDVERDGFVMGEGAGALILEEYEHAVARGAKIYAEVAGGGMTADAYHITAPHPDGMGAFNVIKNALEDADMKPEEIDYVNVHGTSTPLGDIAEVKAIQGVFKDYAYQLNISSTKSMTGHLLGAAGAIEAIASIMAVKHNIVPPTINHFTDDENLDAKLNFTFGKAQHREVRAALSNTFGFGGHNASLIFKKVD